MSNQNRARRRRSRTQAKKQGIPPGTAIYTGDVPHGEPVHVQIIDYQADEVHESDADDSGELAKFLQPNTVTWINLDGVHQVDQVLAVCKTFDVHHLWIEDILNPHGRPKSEQLGDQVFVVARMARTEPGGRLQSEQISMVRGPGWVLTFQERAGDVWDSLRQRIRNDNGRIRRMHSDYLLHALLDDIVDHYYLALEHLEAQVDDLESMALNPETRIDLSLVYELKGELADFRRSVWPMRESVGTLLRSDAGPLSAEVLPYFRDLYDHVVQVMDILETSRERVVGVYELHIAVTSHRLNDIMKVLTIVSTIFIPMTFVAGVYGMNFKHMPELSHPWGYPAVLGVMLGTAVLGGYWIYSRRWLT